MGVNLSSPQKSIGASLSILGMKSDRFDWKYIKKVILKSKTSFVWLKGLRITVFSDKKLFSVLTRYKEPTIWVVIKIF